MADDMKSITAKSGECGARSHRVVTKDGQSRPRPTRESRGDTAHRNTKKDSLHIRELTSHQSACPLMRKLRWLLGQ